MKVLIIGCVAACAALAVAPPRAQACLLSYCRNPSGADGKTSPGAACQITYGDRNHDAGYSDTGGVCNYDSNDAVVVTCPILRDKWGSTNGLECVAAYLTRFDDSPTGCGLSNYNQWECVVQSKDEAGWVGWWEGWSSMAEAGYTTFDQRNGHAVGYWQAKLAHGYQVRDSNPLYMGAYYLSCELPPVGNCGGANCLTSFRWVE